MSRSFDTPPSFGEGKFDPRIAAQRRLDGGSQFSWGRGLSAGGDSAAPANGGRYHGRTASDVLESDGRRKPYPGIKIRE